MNWAVTVTIGWHPILTFSRRRLELLDWIEENLDFHAFLDQPDRVGVRFSGGQSFEIRRDRLTFRTPGADALSDAIAWADQMLAELKPKHPRVIEIDSDWTEAPPHGDYDEVRQTFATRFFPSSDEYVPFDASALFDVETPDGTIQCEYGYVDESELADRLTSEHIGRAQLPAGLDTLPVDVSLPLVALYAKTHFVPRKTTGSLEDRCVESQVAEAVGTCERFVTILGESLRPTEEEGP